MYFKIILIALFVYALILIAYPETRLWLKEFINKRPFLSGSLTCLVFVIITFLYFPLLFKSIAIEFWEIPTTVFQDGTVEVAELADLGPIGDIFGSLNSFISSIALCAVAFSTWLQVTSLKETRETNHKQLLLAEKSHQEQLRETKNSIFLSKFNALLSLKTERERNFYALNKEGQKIEANELFRELYMEFSKKLMKKDSNARFDAIGMKFWINDFFYRSGLGKLQCNWQVYFNTYVDICNLIKESDLLEKDKSFYINLLDNSISYEENFILFILCAIYGDLNGAFRDFRFFNRITLMGFDYIYNNGFDESHFKH